MRPSASRVYCLYQGGWAFFWEMSVTLMMVFQVQVAHLNAFQLVVVGTAMEVTCFLGEVPTGVVADLVSRRLSVVIGLVLMGLAFAVQPLWPTFVGIVLAQVVWGIGYTFTSGAAEAWITDEVGEDRVLPVFTRARQWGLALGIVGTIAAGALGLAGSGVPLLVGGFGFVALAAVLACLMPETGFTPTPPQERETWAHVRRTLVAATSSVRRPGMVRSFMLVALLGGLTSEVFDRLWTAWLLTHFGFPGRGSAVLWITGITLVGNVLALVALTVVNRVAPRAVGSHHPTRILASLVVVRVVATVLFALAGWFWLALGGLWLRQASLAVAQPIEQGWLNRNVSSAARATTLSMAGQADAIGQVAGGPPFGALATRTSIPVAMVVSAVVLAPAAWIYARLRPPAEA